MPRVELRGGPAWAEDSGRAAAIREPQVPRPIHVGPDGFLTGDPEPDLDQLQAALSNLADAGADTRIGHRVDAGNPVQRPVTPQAPGARAPLAQPVVNQSAPRRNGFGESRSRADFERAQRHSRIVALLKIGLPAFAVLTVIVLLAAPFISGMSLPSVDIGPTKIEDGKLVMDNPKLKGTDSNQRPYDLTASKAIQDADHPTRITLEKINARLPMSDTAFARVTAGTGIYDADEKTLRLGDAVAVDTEDGMSIRLQDAAIDIASGKLSTQNPVAVDTGRAYVSAETLSVEDKGSRIVFQDRVRMTIRPASESSGTGSIAIPTMPVIGAINSQGEDASTGQVDSAGQINSAGKAVE